MFHFTTPIVSSQGIKFNTYQNEKRTYLELDHNKSVLLQAALRIHESNPILAAIYKSKADAIQEKMNAMTLEEVAG